MTPDKRDQLYDNLIGSGRVSEKEIGTREDFKNAIKDEESSRQFYKNLSGSGLFTEGEIGTEDEFYGSISSDFTQQPDKQPQVTTSDERTDSVLAAQSWRINEEEEVQQLQPQNPNAWRDEQLEVDIDKQGNPVTMSRGKVHDEL